jgi:glycerol-3-phosphate acyltransferase PlsY
METWGPLTYYVAFTLLLIAYLLGSIPSAVWIGKKFYGIDIREHGSKNAGTTNMLRVLGKRAALPVFVIDYFKGFAGVMLTWLLSFDPALSEAWLINMRIIATGAVVLGHIFPIFAGFRGGKGVATLLGAGTAIFPPILLMCFGFWCLVFAVSHYVSLASMVAGCCYPILVMIFSIMPANPSTALESIPFIVFSWAVAILLVWTHRKNIGRLRDGTESKIYLWFKPTSEDGQKPQPMPANSKTLGQLIYDEYRYAREDVNNQK